MNQNKYSDWSPIRNLLKEKYCSTSTTGINAQEQIPDNKYWNKFQQITGKSKEQIQTELRTF